MAAPDPSHACSDSSMGEAAAAAAPRPPVSANQIAAVLRILVAGVAVALLASRPPLFVLASLAVLTFVARSSRRS
jgi:hypothetical protein